MALSEFEEVDRSQNLCKGRRKERTKKGDQQALAGDQKYGNQEQENNNSGVKAKESCHFQD